MTINTNDDWLYEGNVVFSLLEGDVEKKLLKWDGTNVQSFADALSIEEYENMDFWSQNHAFGTVCTYEEFPDLDWEDASQFTTDIRSYILKQFISDCLMMVTQGQACFEQYEQKDLVKHFYKLWMAVNGGC